MSVSGSNSELTLTDVSPEQAALAAGPIIAAILQWLPLVQRCSLLSVNRAWRAAGDDPDIWAGLTLAQKQKILIAACRSGDLTYLRKRTTVFGLAAADVRACSFAICETACKGYLACAQWLVNYAQLTQIDIQVGRNLPLRVACVNGHLEMAQWLVAHFNLASTDVQATVILRETCIHGRIAVAEWLAAHFNITSADVQYEGILYEVCRVGRLATAQWLAKYFNLNTNNEQVEYALYRACAHSGHLPTVEWLVTHFGLTAADIRNDFPLHVCSGGHVAIAQWMVTRLGLTFNDFFTNLHGNGRSPIHMAAFHGHLELTQWLVARFHPSAIQVGSLLYWALQGGKLAVVEWLVVHFGVDDMLLAAARSSKLRTPAEEWLVQYCDRRRQSD